MQQYEYRVVPAPKRGTKQRGLKTVQDRFAFALTELMNQMAREGWEYQRADALPCEEKVGLTGRTQNYHNLLVFRRALAVAQPVAAVAAPMAAVAQPQPAPQPAAAPLRLGPAQADAGAAPAVGAAPVTAPVAAQ